MASEKKPFFSVVIPLYNKQSHVKETIETVFNQTFQDYEIVVVNDGSTDESAKVVESLQDNRIRLIHQENAGVSAARNHGIKEAKADYIAFLDADDLWLPKFLQTIYDMIIDFPNAGMYATRFEQVDNAGKHTPRMVRGLPSDEYVGIIPKFFKSATLGDYPVWTSAICIPKKIFFDNNIWFPVGEKYAEDHHVWSRVAMQFDVAFNTDICALYMIEAENNTIGENSNVKEPYKSILSLREFRHLIKDKEEVKYFDLYIKSWIYYFILVNIKNRDSKYAIKNFFSYELSLKHRVILIFLFLIPFKLQPFFKKIYKKVKFNVSKI